MYRVTVTTDGKEYLLHDPRDEEIQFIDAELTDEMGKHPIFTCTIPPTHPNKDKIIPMSSQIKVYRDKELLACCRMLNGQSDFYNTGQITCEGESAYLVDSIRRPYEYSGNARDLFVQIINSHNAQVEDYKRMEPGNLDVAGDIVRSNTEYIRTISDMVATFCTGKGCYFHLRYGEDGKKYMDCVKDYGGINKQPIRFGVNLISLNKRIDPQTLITALIPTGEDMDVPDGSGDRKPVNITSVNGGKDYIVHDAAVKRHGMIWGQVKFDGVTDPEVLIAKAKAYLDDVVTLSETIEVRAIDLSHVEKDTLPFKVGYWTDVISKPHGLNTRMLIAKMVISLTDPRKCVISLGSVRPSFTMEAAREKVQTSARIASVASSSSKEINRKVDNATQLITGAKGGYVVLDVDDPDTGERALPWRILVMDAPEKTDAHNVIQINKNGLGFSTTGINGPYRNAWTIDGNLVADFVTSGQMLADRIRGGILEVGGSGLAKDGKIIVKDAGDRQIGYWDKTGLHVFLGVIEGTDIIGGSINIGDGTFEVDKYGAVMMNSGQIAIGNTLITSGYAWLGDYGISSGNAGLFYSRGKGNTIQITSMDNMEEPIGLTVRNGSAKTFYTAGGIVTTGDITFRDPWTEGMTALDMFKDLYNRLNNLRNQ